MTPRSPIVAALYLAYLVLAGCGAQDADKPVASPVAPAAATPAAAVIPAPAAAMVVAAGPQTAPLAPVPPGPGPLYVCVSESASGQLRTTIDLASSVDALCRKAPEMGPCQYEREACRRGGGKVVTADGTEITRQTEAEYDRRVMRIRMKSN